MDVIVYQGDGRDEGTWASQWVAAGAGRSRIVMPGNVTIPQAIAVLARAGRAARGGQVLLLVGHGGSAGAHFGMVDLAPHRRFRIETDIVFYNVDPDGPHGAATSQAEADQRSIQTQPQPGDDPSYIAMIPGLQASARERRAFRARYDEAGRALDGVRRVIFLACNVGNATNFLDQMARDWRVEIQAYRRRVATMPMSSRRSAPVRLYLFDDALDTGTNVAAAETALPSVDFYVAHP